MPRDPLLASLSDPEHSVPPDSAFSLRPILSRIGRVVGLLVRILMLAWLVGQFFRDWLLLTALCFYIPTPLLVVCWFLYSLTASRSPRLMVRRLLWLILPMISLLFVEHHWDQREKTLEGRPFQRLIHWNIHLGNRGMPNIAGVVHQLNPELVVFSEVPLKKREVELRREFGSEYAVLRIDGMMFFARGSLVQREIEPIRKGVTVGLVEWTFSGQTRLILVADLPSFFLIHRDPLLRGLVERIEKYQPDFVLGDLNSPRLSRQLSHLPRGYQHAYDAVGAGWSATWPVGPPTYYCESFFPKKHPVLPLWSLDQCLFGPRVDPARYRLIPTIYSDHSLQLIDVFGPPRE